MPTDRRVQFDFEVDFSNGGGIQGQGFRLDIEGADISEAALCDYLVRDLRLLMVAEVRIINKTILVEAHKRGEDSRPVGESRSRLVDLSHTVEDGMVTYRGLPPPQISDFLTRESSRERYAPGTQFHIGRIDMVANTGTYVDSPFHRFANGADLSELLLETLADLPALVVRVTEAADRAIDRSSLLPYDVAGKAVLIHTGWAAWWRTDQYFEGHPHLTAVAATWLVENGAALVGIDSFNIDSISTGERPVHTTLLAQGIPIVEHLRGLEQLPSEGARFTAVPVKVRGMGTFPVRAFASLSSGPGHG
ncbi:MAG: cyclase family protein [Acidimicrobiia bacterium]